MAERFSFKIVDKNGYDKRYKLNDSRYLSCYSRKQLKKIYDLDEYIVVGEMLNEESMHPNSLGYVKYSCCVRPVFRVESFSRWRYMEKGYVECESSGYEYRTELIILLQDAFWLRLLQGVGFIVALLFVFCLLLLMI